ncbi:uncharacterized protein LOC106168132 isoform X2 [Lingula anatina]|uniref:Uncharacterized protein LOC106168132 isoform X2 n=1 Tax=Lingula anatina TaxID=7574 RepID=A0A1S3IWH0_LINAN|nr:uncharacterized protein LOC106168132 isoform X2 [Lingula anatina]|eukprot:XP_013402535.1 uncharacterized protein LOC106168132 isoform X2 [Lingula anatina]
MTTMMYQAPQVVRQPVIITAPPAGSFSPFIAEKYMHRAGVGLGITQTVLGVISFIFGVVFTAWIPARFLGSINHHTGAGVWCGTVFVVTGVLGILTRKKNKGLIISYMIMSIVSAVISWIVLIGISSIDLAAVRWHFLFDWDYYASVITGLSGFFIFLSFVEGLVAVISAAICGHAVCCCSKPSSQGTVTYTVPNTGQNTVAYMVPGQQGFVYYPQQGPHVGGYNAQLMYAQGLPAYNTAQQQQQPLQAQPPEKQPKGGATGQEAESL